MLQSKLAGAPRAHGARDMDFSGLHHTRARRGRLNSANLQNKQAVTTPARAWGALSQRRWGFHGEP